MINIFWQCITQGEGDLKSVSVGEVIKLTTLQGARTLIRKFLVKSCLIVTLNFIWEAYLTFYLHCIHLSLSQDRFPHHKLPELCWCFHWPRYLCFLRNLPLKWINLIGGIVELTFSLHNITSISSTSGSSSVSGSGYRAWLTRSAWSWIVPASMSGLMNTIASENGQNLHTKWWKAKRKTQPKPLDKPFAVYILVCPPFLVNSSHGHEHNSKVTDISSTAH